MRRWLSSSPLPLRKQYGPFSDSKPEISTAKLNNNPTNSNYQNRNRNQDLQRKPRFQNHKEGSGSKLNGNPKSSANYQYQDRNRTLDLQRKPRFQNHEEVSSSPIKQDLLLDLNSIISVQRREPYEWNKRSIDYKKALNKWMKRFELTDLRVKSLACALEHTPHQTFDGAKGNKLGAKELAIVGDAVLDLLVVSHIIGKYKILDRRSMHTRRMNMVNDKSLSAVCRKFLDLDALIIHQGREIISDRKQADNFGDQICSDVVEALLGAIYIDLGIERAAKFGERFLIPALSHFDKKSHSGFINSLKNHLPDAARKISERKNRIDKGAVLKDIAEKLSTVKISNN